MRGKPLKILLVHSGGTIGMVQSPQGFEPRLGVVEAAVAAMGLPDQIEIITLEPLIDSANATPVDWDRISQTIAENYAAFDGFVVTHGTDTLAYTAAALGFALEGLGKPVILTGSMLPLSVEHNDGLANLSQAFAALAEAGPGVWVQFAGRLLHGARVRKTHSRAFDAFNADPSHIAPCWQGKTLRHHISGASRVVTLNFAPGVPAELFRCAAESFDGMVLRCYGSGTAPDSEAMSAALHLAQMREVPVLAVSQCPEGGLAMGTYAAAAILQRHGVIDGRDMTVEAAYAKLHYALSKSGDFEECRAWLERSVCGELTPEQSDV